MYEGSDAAAAAADCEGGDGAHGHVSNGLSWDQSQLPGGDVTAIIWSETQPFGLINGEHMTK